LILIDPNNKQSQQFLSQESINVQPKRKEIRISSFGNLHSLILTVVKGDRCIVIPIGFTSVFQMQNHWLSLEVGLGNHGSFKYQCKVVGGLEGEWKKSPTAAIQNVFLRVIKKQVNGLNGALNMGITYPSIQDHLFQKKGNEILFALENREYQTQGGPSVTSDRIQALKREIKSQFTNGVPATVLPVQVPTFPVQVATRHPIQIIPLSIGLIQTTRMSPSSNGMSLLPDVATLSPSNGMPPPTTTGMPLLSTVVTPPSTAIVSKEGQMKRYIQESQALIKKMKLLAAELDD